MLHTFILLSERARPLVRLADQRVDAFVAVFGLGCRRYRVVRDDQPQPVPGLLRDHFPRGGDTLQFVEGGEQFDELVVAPAWHCDDELERRFGTGQAHGLQRPQIVRAEQPPVGDLHQALRRR